MSGTAAGNACPDESVVGRHASAKAEPFIEAWRPCRGAVSLRSQPLSGSVDCPIISSSSVIVLRHSRTVLPLGQGLAVKLASLCAPVAGDRLAILRTLSKTRCSDLSLSELYPGGSTAGCCCRHRANSNRRGPGHGVSLPFRPTTFSLRA